MHEVLFFGGHGVQIRRCRTCWNDHRRLGKPGAHHRHRTQVVQLPRGQETNLAFTPVQNLLDQSAKFQRGGGIMVYCKHHIGRTEVFRTELTAESADKTECVAIELRVDGEKILLVVVYNPPRNDCSEFLAAKLSEFGTRYENVLLIADLNTDSAVPSTLRERFTEVLQTHALFSVDVEPTEVAHNWTSS
ncbi:hypothetical protein quinque_002456 [Culex quinquefasciatus]